MIGLVPGDPLGDSVGGLDPDLALWVPVRVRVILPLRGFSSTIAKGTTVD